MRGRLSQFRRRYARWRSRTAQACSFAAPANFRSTALAKGAAERLLRALYQLHTLVHRRALGNAIEKQQLISREPQRGKHLRVERSTSATSVLQSAVEQRPPAQNAHHQFGGQAMIGGGQLGVA